jgi:hypothetical protein
MAATHNAASTEIRDPGTYATPGGLNVLFIVLIVVGFGIFAAGLSADHQRAWVSFLQNHFFFMSLAIGGAFFASIQWLTNAMWSAPVRRISESFTAYLPFALLTFVVLYFGMHDLYVWTHADHVEHDVLLKGKSGYLNVGFFFVRNVIALAAWIFFAWKMVGNSVHQDTTKDVALTLRNRFLSAPFLLVFGITFTMASFDLMMSLDPHWFSTIFGVYCFAGLFYSTLALTCLVTLYFQRQGRLTGIVNDNHLHDLGKFMFAFTVFWAYIGFSQFMLIWYANLPEETGYFIRRLNNGWMNVSIFLLVGKFLTPFLVLLPRDAKRDSRVLAAVGVFMLIAQWIDILWLVQPEFYKEGPKLGWIELGVPLGFIGLFGFAVARFFARNRIVAIGDPRLADSVFHHHQ